MKLLVEEAESEALLGYLLMEPVEAGERTLVSSWLLHTELHCAANRHPEDVDPGSVSVVLESVTLIDVTRGDLLTAGVLPGRLRSNDATHLAAALRIGAEQMLTYDAELAEAAIAAGVPVVQPR